MSELIKGDDAGNKEAASIGHDRIKIKLMWFCYPFFQMFDQYN